MMKRDRNTDSIKEQFPNTNRKRSATSTVSTAKLKNIINFYLKNLKNLKKKNIVFIAAMLTLALTIPLVFATAANTNEVANIAPINMQTAASASSSPQSTPTILPATLGGDLTSDLTDNAAQPAPTPTSSANPAVSPASSADPAVLPTTTPPADPTTAALTDNTSETLQSAYSVLSPGMNDPFIAMIQQRLMDLNYMDQDDPDTLYGPVTAQSITYFQRKNGLPQDGIAGIQTQALLFSTSAKPYSVSVGDSGPDVQSIQDRLVELGYSVGDTGYFGTDTTKAVQNFQKINGLTADGNVGSNSSEVLYSQNAVPSAEYTATKKAASSSSKSSSSGSSSTNKSSGSSSNSSTPASSTPAISTPAPAANTGNVEAFVNAGLAELGKSYVLGGKGPDVFDCSGLVYYALKASGNGIGYMTSYGWGDAGQYARISSMKDLQRGDVVCESGHVGIYLGNEQIVNASSSNGKVIISSNVFSSSYWVGHFICGRRPL